MTWFKKKVSPPDTCEHQWKVVAATYRPPMSQWEASGFVDNAMIERLISGMTTVTQQCTKCGYVDSRRHLGRVTPPGYRWSSDRERRTA